MYSELIIAIEKTRSRENIQLFFNEFLTPTEKIMFAKRFSAIYMISRELPHSYIVLALGMSPATIARMSLKYENGKYTFLTTSFKSIDKSVWAILEKIMKAGMPPKVGRGRWKFLYEK